MKHLVFAVFTLLLLMPTALAQENAEPIEPIDAEMANPEAHISWPPPVYVVRDNVEIRGTVSLAAMRNFFIEFRPLMLDMMDDDEETNPWLPGTLPRIEAVADDILGSWNTVTLRDGLYELRLTINTGGSEPEHYRVSPIRVENNPPDSVPEPQVEVVVVAPEAETRAEQPVEEPTPEPEAAPTEDPRPHVVAAVNSNVRAGDSTLYGVIGFLLEGESALIKGVSSYGTGWYYIELPNGRSGFIYPHIVTTRGDLGNLPRINPPPLPPTAIPAPTAVPAPQQPPSTGADLVFHSVRVDPHPADCNETYRIDVTVRNAGSGPATSGGNILVTDRGVNGTAQAQTTNIAYGPLAPGHTQEVFGHLTPTLHYETIHHITMQLDSNNQVTETNEGNNFHADAPYFMARGSC